MSTCGSTCGGGMEFFVDSPYVPGPVYTETGKQCQYTAQGELICVTKKAKTVNVPVEEKKEMHVETYDDDECL